MITASDLNEDINDFKKKVLNKKNNIKPYIINPKITLIMQFFNHEVMIPKHVERIKKNKIIDEVIICEDGSSDDSLNLWNKHLTGRNDVIIRTNDYHEIISYNRSARYANGEYLVFCQDDDLLPADDYWLKNAIKLFENDEKLGLIGFLSGDLFKKNKDINSQRRRKEYKWFGPDRILGESGNSINTTLLDIKFMYISAIILGPVIIKKSLFDKLGGWDYKLCEPGLCGIGLDWDLSFRCWKQGYRVGCMPLEPKLKDDITNTILEDKYFYYRYGYRGTINFGYESRGKQFKKNIKIINKKIDSYGNNFLENVYENIKMLNKGLKNN